MIVINNFNPERIILANECAEFLGLKEISTCLYEFGVNISELPQDINNEISKSIDESSLLSMGLVYSYNGILTFINKDGHTMVMPASKIIKEELEKCGYLICRYGQSVPDLRNVDENSNEYRRILDQYREKYTLPEELVKKVYNQELGVFPTKYSEEFAYDVFSTKYYRGQILGPKQIFDIAMNFDLRDRTTRKLLAFYHGNPSLIDVNKNINNLEEYLRDAMKNDILCDREYYSANGLFSYFSKEKLNYHQAKEKNKLMNNIPKEYGLNENGDLTDEPNQIIKPLK